MHNFSVKLCFYCCSRAVNWLYAAVTQGQSLLEVLKHGRLPETKRPDGAKTCKFLTKTCWSQHYMDALLKSALKKYVLIKCGKCKRVWDEDKNENAQLKVQLLCRLMLVWVRPLVPFIFFSAFTAALFRGVLYVPE